mmetsp:Transcript_23279/g.47613  ORF Transcript_23279/g.47613 Transcript_23279/m.47613 type:complete len:237 (+) Transcript_23279:425-1135(+)
MTATTERRHRKQVEHPPAGYLTEIVWVAAVGPQPRINETLGVRAWVFIHSAPPVLFFLVRKHLGVCGGLPKDQQQVEGGCQDVEHIERLVGVVGGHNGHGEGEDLGELKEVHEHECEHFELEPRVPRAHLLPPVVFAAAEPSLDEEVVRQAKSPNRRAHRHKNDAAVATSPSRRSHLAANHKIPAVAPRQHGPEAVDDAWVSETLQGVLVEVPSQAQHPAAESDNLCNDHQSTPRV